ncbi:hypothetical protein PM10SUCC1_00940 [Propionigenium maris DSM 9537]|uniref:Uncharacterized protein n=2 Tax=Propionigenium TaxID=2332 RepID=A0A9W6GG07_9FUSO|nr:hypothetical protein PM10SUCC1_00940 [Propionigenium maris DSM 9537]
MDRIEDLIGRIKILCERYEAEEGELIRNIVKGIELEEKLDKVEELLREIEGELKNREE